MSTSTKLFTLPPTKTRGRHLSALESVHAKNLRVNVIEAENAVTDSLKNPNGDDLVNAELLAFDRSATQPAPGAGKGRVWVEDAGSPYPLVFTNDAGTNIRMLPTLESVLLTSTDANNQTMSNIASLQFDSSNNVNIGTQNETAGGTGLSIGEGADSATADSIAVGAQTTAVAGADATVVGYNSSSSAGPATVIGSNISSRGETICVGHNITIPTTVNASPCVLIGRNITAPPLATASQTICIGDEAVWSSAGQIIIGAQAGGNNNTGETSNVVGYGAHGSNVTIAFGSEAQSSALYSVAVGRQASASNILGIAGGFQAAASTGTGSIAWGAYTSASGVRSIAIGGGTAPGDGATASGALSIAVGNATVAAHPGSICLGSNIESRVAHEIGGRGFKIVRGTAQTTNGTSTVVLTFPTVLGDVIQVDAAVTGYSTTDNKTFLASFTNQHFRYKSAGLSKSSGIGSVLIDNSETTSFNATITAIGENIAVTVTGSAGKTVNWQAVLRLYCTPLV